VRGSHLASQSESEHSCSGIARAIHVYAAHITNEIPFIASRPRRGSGDLFLPEYDPDSNIMLGSRRLIVFSFKPRIVLMRTRQSLLVYDSITLIVS
jgi:hypothetical protein